MESRIRRLYGGCGLRSAFEEENRERPGKSGAFENGFRAWLRVCKIICKIIQDGIKFFWSNSDKIYFYRSEKRDFDKKRDSGKKFLKRKRKCVSKKCDFVKNDAGNEFLKNAFSNNRFGKKSKIVSKK